MVHQSQVEAIASAIDAMQATVERIERLLLIADSPYDELLDSSQTTLEDGDPSGQI